MKKILSVALITAMALSLCACETGESNKAPKDEISEVSTKKEEKAGNAEAGSIAEAGIIPDLSSYYVTEDEIKWEYNSSSRTLVFSGEGPMRDYLDEEPEWNSYCSEAQKVIIGDEITSVGAGAFWWFDGLTEVSLGEAVEYIGTNAFSNCYNLWTVNFPDALKVVEAGAFSNALLHSENGFTLPEGLQYIGDSAFYSAFKESFVSIPASVTYIGHDAFANCFVDEFIIDEGNEYYSSADGVFFDEAKEVLMYYPAGKQDGQYEIPDGVKVINEDAFSVNSYIDKLIIPASVADINECAIYWNYSLLNIEVAEDNPNYKSVSGVLLTKDGKNLVAYPLGSPADDYSIPEGVERIWPYSMSGASSFVHVHIPEGVKNISSYAFCNCSNLTEIGLPASLESVDDSAFLWCDALTRVNYASTGEDWDKIVFYENNDLFTNGQVTVYPTE